MKTAQALHGMHHAVADAREAAKIRDALGAKLDSVRERLPAQEDAAASPVDPRAAEAARIAQVGQVPMREPGSPLPTPLNTERPWTPVTPTERDGQQR